MESRSVASIEYIEANELYNWLQQGKTGLGQPFQVVDVRGSDFIGGHIVGCLHYPYRSLSQDQEYIQDLKNTLNKSRIHDDDIVYVVFHCAQSQQRGPSAAMKLLRHLTNEEMKHFKICILRGGFNHWQDIYGEDDTVTEGYEPALWAW